MINKILKLSSTIMLSTVYEVPLVSMTNMYIYVGYGENLTEKDFIERYVIIEDNKTAFEDLIIWFEPKLDLSWPKSNGYAFVYVKDEDNNIGSSYFLYYVLDDVAPEIYGPDTLTFNSNSNITIEQIISYYSAFDEVDGALTITCDDVIENKSKIIKLKAVDNSNNVAIKNVKVNFVEKNNFWYIESTIDVTNKKLFNAEEIVNLLIEKDLMQNIDYLYANYNSNLYVNNYMITGLYTVGIDIYSLENNSPFTIKVNINVIDEETDEEISETHWWDSLFLFIKKLFQKIIDFFTF